MTDRAKWVRRPYFYAALLISLVALAIPVSEGIASSTPNTATAPIEKHALNCGYPTGHQQIGKVRFIREKDNSIIVDVTFYGADPTHHDRLDLNYNEFNRVDPPYCSHYTTLGDHLKVFDGRFHKVFKVTGVSQWYNQFWIDGYNADTGLYDQSTQVKI